MCVARRMMAAMPINATGARVLLNGRDISATAPVTTVVVDGATLLKPPRLPAWNTRVPWPHDEDMPTIKWAFRRLAQPDDLPGEFPARLAALGLGPDLIAWVLAD